VSPRELLDTLRSGRGTAPVVGRYAAVAVVYVAFMNVVVGLSASNILNGIALGSLYGIIAVALVLVYRTSRIINFAAAALGAVPAITALLLTTTVGVSYILTLPVAILGGLAVGAATDVVVMRRFASSPRLIVTVVTIGLAQTFAVVGFFLPVWFGERADQPPVVETPWTGLALESSRGEPVLSGNQVFAFVVVGVLTAGLALFFARSRMGMAVRACAENAERAALLGIPVKRVSTVAWALAGLLSSLAIFAQAPLIGVPSNATLGFDTLLYGLAAAVVASATSASAGTCLVDGGGRGDRDLPLRARRGLRYARERLALGELDGRRVPAAGGHEQPEDPVAGVLDEADHVAERRGALEQAGEGPQRLGVEHGVEGGRAVDGADDGVVGGLHDRVHQRDRRRPLVDQRLDGGPGRLERVGEAGEAVDARTECIAVRGQDAGEVGDVVDQALDLVAVLRQRGRQLPRARHDAADVVAASVEGGGQLVGDGGERVGVDRLDQRVQGPEQVAVLERAGGAGQLDAVAVGEPRTAVGIGARRRCEVDVGLADGRAPPGGRDDVRGQVVGAVDGQLDLAPPRREVHASDAADGVAEVGDRVAGPQAR